MHAENTQFIENTKTRKVLKSRNCGKLERIWNTENLGIGRKYVRGISRLTETRLEHGVQEIGGNWSTRLSLHSPVKWIASESTAILEESD